MLDSLVAGASFKFNENEDEEEAEMIFQDQFLPLEKDLNNESSIDVKREDKQTFKVNDKNERYSKLIDQPSSERGAT